MKLHFIHHIKKFPPSLHKLHSTLSLLYWKQRTFVTVRRYIVLWNWVCSPSQTSHASKETIPAWICRFGSSVILRYMPTIENKIYRGLLSCKSRRDKETVRIKQQDAWYDKMSSFLNFNLYQTGYYCDDEIEVSGMGRRVACVTGWQ